MPPNLERIVLGALSKDPRQRPASARAFTTMLREYRTSHNQQTQVVPVQPAPGPNAPATPPTPPTPPTPGPNTPTAVVPRQTPAPRQRDTPPQPQPAAPVPPPRRVAPNVPPPLAQQPAAPRRGFPFGGLLLGLLLLGGVLGLAYVALGTDTLQSFFGGGTSPTAQPAAPTARPAPTAQPAAQVTLPNFVGQSEVNARNAIAAAGLVAEPHDPREDAAAAGMVIEQEPGPNTAVPAGSTVRLVISLGPPPATAAPPTATPEPIPPTATPEPIPPTPTVLQLADVTGQSADQILTQLTAAGFRLNRIDRPDRTVPAGRIITQQPAPGAYAPDTVVTLTVGQGDVIVFPAVVGADRKVAEDTIRATPDLQLDVVDEQGPDQLPNFDQITPNQVVSATANGRPVQNGQLVPRTALIVLGVRRP